MNILKHYLNNREFKINFHFYIIFNKISLLWKKFRINLKMNLIIFKTFNHFEKNKVLTCIFAVIYFGCYHLKFSKYNFIYFL